MRGTPWKAQDELGGFRTFEWDEGKQQTNLAKHGVDFVDAAKALLGPHIVRDAGYEGERRSVAICDGRPLHRGRLYRAKRNLPNNFGKSSKTE
jgi:hypothetical protein